jgi:hypothetical protein
MGKKSVVFASCPLGNITNVLMFSPPQTFLHSCFALRSYNLTTNSTRAVNIDSSFISHCTSYDRA